MTTTIEETIWRHAAELPGKSAVVSGRESVGYGDLPKRIVFAANVYESLAGYARGGKVVLAAEKQVDFLFAYFGAHMAGLTVILIDAQTKAERLAEIIRLYSPFAVVGFEDVVSPIQKFPLGAFCGETDIGNASLRFPDPEDVSYILFTTGTTGLPKAVPHTFKDEIASARLMNGYIGNTRDDRELLALPISHAFGLGRMRCGLVNGQTIHLLNSFANVKKVFQTMEEAKITGFSMVPASWRFLKKMSGTAISKFADQLRYIELGTAFLSEDEKRQIAGLFPKTRVVMNYGLTEAPRSGFLAFHEDADFLSSVGKACPGAEIAVFGENGRRLPAGEVGEICVKGPHVTKGYLSVDNSQTFHGEFFRTGDCGYMSPDGYIYLKSRIKELINVGGEKVGPAEVDEQILKVAGVEDCACVGVPDPSGVLGEVVKAFVVKSPDSDVTFDAIREFLKDKLEPFKIPLIYSWVDEIPKAKNGKVLRRLLKEMN